MFRLWMNLSGNSGNSGNFAVDLLMYYCVVYVADLL